VVGAFCWTARPRGCNRARHSYSVRHEGPATFNVGGPHAPSGSQPGYDIFRRSAGDSSRMGTRPALPRRRSRFCPEAEGSRPRRTAARVLLFRGCSSELMIDRSLAFRAVRMQLTGPACLGQPPSAATARRRIRFWSRAPHVRWRGSPVSCSCSPGSAKGLRIPFVRRGRPIAGKPVKGRHWVIAPDAESGSCGRDAGAADRSAYRAPDRRSTVRQCRALSGPQPRLPPPLPRARSSAPGRPCSCENT
jgi:hypothetical protein